MSDDPIRIRLMLTGVEAEELIRAARDRASDSEWKEVVVGSKLRVRSLKRAIQKLEDVVRAETNRTSRT